MVASSDERAYEPTSALRRRTYPTVPSSHIGLLVLVTLCVAPASGDDIADVPHL